VTRGNRFSLSCVVPPLALAVLILVPAPGRAGDGVVPDHDQPKAKSYRPEARIDEQIGGQVPMDLTFRDEDEQPIKFGDAMAGKATILVPVYYRCPMLCTKVLNGVLEALRQMPADFSAGNQFTVVTVSMDPKEHSDLAKAKKYAYLNGDPKSGQAGYGRPGSEAGWRFLTGTKENIAGLLDAVGFKFEFDKMLKEYNHPSGIVILSPTGKITRYFHGIGYDGEFELDVPAADAKTDAKGKVTRPTTTLRLSLIEAADGKGGSLLDKITLLCYRYDQLHQGYALKVLWVVRIGGIITLTALVTGVLWALRRERRKARAEAAALNPADVGKPAHEQPTAALSSGGTA
jgi:protein SCO1/2